MPYSLSVELWIVIVVHHRRKGEDAELVEVFSSDTVLIKLDRTNQQTTHPLLLLFHPINVLLLIMDHKLNRNWHERAGKTVLRFIYLLVYLSIF